MCRVQVKVPGSDSNIFRIRRLHYQQTARFQYAKCFRHHSPQLIERDVLNDVKGRDYGLTFIGECRKKCKRISTLCRQIQLETALKHSFVLINTTRQKSFSQKNFEPFTPPATQIDRMQGGSGINFLQGQDKRAICIQPR